MLLRPDVCLYANRSSSNAYIMVLPKLISVLHYFLLYHVGDNLQYALYGFRVSAELAGVLLTLLFVWNVSARSSWKQSAVIHRI